MSPIDIRDGVDLQLLVQHHNEAVRAVEGVRRQLEIMTDLQRDLSGRVDSLEGLPNGSTGDAWRSESDGLKLQLHELGTRMDNAFSPTR